MSLGNLTITGTLGPAQAVTAKSYPNVNSIKFDIEKNVMAIEFAPPNQPRRIQYFDYALTTAVTYSLSGANGTATITVS